MLNENLRCFFQLLVVIAIIAILASMLLPALNKARSSGQATTCKANLKNIGLFINMYCDISNDYMPVVFDKGNTTGEWIWARLEKMKLGLSNKVYKDTGCTVKRPKIEEKKATNDYYNYAGYALYGYNSYFGYIASYVNGVPTPGTAWSTKYGFVKRGAIKDVSKKMCVADANRQVNLAYMRYYTDYTQDHIAYLHNNVSTNLLFVPGHVENHTLADFALPQQGTHDATTNKWMKPEKNF